MIKLPVNDQWQTSLDSDLFGSISSTKNLTFAKKGYVGAARKAIGLYSEVNDADFGTPQVITADDSYAYIITTDKGYTLNLVSDSFTVTEMASNPSFGSQTDATFYQGLMHATTTQTVQSYSGGPGGSWTSRITGLSSSYPHPLCVMENRQTLLIGDGHTLKQYTSGYAVDTGNQLTIPQDYVIEWVRYRQSTAIIGTRNINGGEAKIFLWNGTGVGFQTAYGIGADWAYSGCEYGSSIAVIASSGRLLRFNGGGFDELATLPVWGTPYPWTASSATNNLVGRVASRGMQAYGDILYINLDGRLDIQQGEAPGNFLPEQPSGVWVYDPKVGLYHKAGYVFDTKQSLIPTSIDSQFLVFSTPHQALTGDAVLYPTAAGGITGINPGQTYYAIVGGANTIQLALSEADAHAGRAILLGGTVTTDTFVFDRYESVGSSMIERPGPIFVLGTPHLNTFYGTEVLFAGGAWDEDLQSRSILMSLGMGRSVARFSTPKIPASAVQDTLQKIYAKFPRLDLDSEQIVVKYRSTTRFGLPSQPSIYMAGITWTSQTTLTVDTTQVDFKSAQVGDEIEFIAGVGAGYTAHIEDIDDTTSTYVVTIDESLPVTNGDKTDFVVDNWVKHKVITNQTITNDQNFAELPNFNKSTWFQLRIELRGRDIMLKNLDFINTPMKQNA